MTPNDRLNALRDQFDARAAGWYRVASDRLEQVAFCVAADMPDEVALTFAEATRSVLLVQGDLGIVRAAVSGETAVSRANKLPGDSGSGLWLRKFAATRSVAVPIRDGGGAVVRVVSLALEGNSPDDDSVARAIRTQAQDWPDV